MKHNFKIGDKVKLLKNGAKNTYTSPRDETNRRLAKKQEGMTGVIDYILPGSRIALVITKEVDKYYWNLDYIAEYDEPREIMLELESKL